MSNIDELKKEEIVNLQTDDVKLEDLILLGADKKIPITIEFPKPNGEKVKAKAYVKQLTLKELDNLKLNQNNMVQVNIMVLKKALLKQDGTPFNEEQIKSLPIGVVNAISEKIMELSGVDEKMNQRLTDF